VACHLQNIPQPIIIEVHEDWCPYGARRFLDLVSLGFYDQTPIHRAIEDFIAQFGLYLPEREEEYRALFKTNKINENDGADLFFKPILDDNNSIGNENKNQKKIPFLKGMISFAGYGSFKTRQSQVFIALSHLPYLGKAKWETPFGFVQPSSMSLLKEIYKGYGELTSSLTANNNNKGPNIDKLYPSSNAAGSGAGGAGAGSETITSYLKNEFPKLTVIEKCEIINLSKNTTFRNLILIKDISTSRRLIPSQTYKDGTGDSTIGAASSDATNTHGDTTASTSTTERVLKSEALFGLIFLFVATFIIVYQLLQQLGDQDINIDTSFMDNTAFKDL
jgi:cyclophilin family peptidyl-prolyl cis-trans isomerase